MGQQPTKGPPPNTMRKQPPPLKTGAWEWWTTGYFDEAPEENGLTITNGKVASWIGKIQGLEYQNTTHSQRPEWIPHSVTTGSVGELKAPSMYFDGITNALKFPHAGALNFMHNGTGGTVFMVCTLDDNSTNCPWTSGGTSSSSHVGFVMNFLSAGGSLRAVIVRGDGYVAITADTINNKATGTSSGGFGLSYSEADGISTFYDGLEFHNAAQSLTPTGSNTTYDSAIGRQGNSAAFYNGYVTDLILWDRVITDAERDEVLAWAKHRIKE